MGVLDDLIRHSPINEMTVEQLEAFHALVGVELDRRRRGEPPTVIDR
jgi:hypothetical protein